MAILFLLFLFIFETFWIALITTLATLYITLAFVGVVFEAYDDRLVVTFPFRPLSRRYDFNLSQITDLKFYDRISGRFSYPTLHIYYQSEQGVKHFVFSFISPSTNDMQQLKAYLDNIQSPENNEHDKV